MNRHEREDARLRQQPSIKTKGHIPSSVPESTPFRPSRQAAATFAAVRASSEPAKARSYFGSEG